MPTLEDILADPLAGGHRPGREGEWTLALSLTANRASKVELLMTVNAVPAPSREDPGTARRSSDARGRTMTDRPIFVPVALPLDEARALFSAARSVCVYGYWTRS